MPRIHCHGARGYLAATTDVEHYDPTAAEIRETVDLPEIETEEVAKVFREYGLTEKQMEPIVTAIGDLALGDFADEIRIGPRAGPSKGQPKRADHRCRLHFGGLSRWRLMLQSSATQGLRDSVAITLVALAAFGFIKSRFVGLRHGKARCRPS